MVLSLLISSALPVLRYYSRAEPSLRTFYSVPVDKNFDQNWETFRTEWSKELATEQPSILKGLWRTCKRPYLTGTALVVFNYLSIMCQGILLAWFVEMLGQEDTSGVTIGLFATGLAALALATLILYNYGYYRLNMLGASVKPWLAALLAEKAASFPVYQKAEHPAKLLSTANTELGSFDLLNGTSNIWAIPLVFPLAIAALISYLGYAGLISVVLVLLHLVAILVLASFNMKFRPTATDYGEERVATVLNILEGIRAIKLFSWETLCAKQVELVRKAESQEYRKMSIVMALAKCLNLGLAGSSILIPLLVVEAEGYKVQVGDVLASIIVLFVLNTLLTYDGIIGASIVLFFVTSCHRITEVLLLEEAPRDTWRSAAPDLTCSDAIFSWEGDYRLSVNFRANRGEIIAVTGAPGSGKSTLLLGLLGELPLLKGSLSSERSFGYCSNPPFIYKGSLRDNITMNSAFHEKRYARALQYSQLTDELQSIISDDCTTLSSGQKMRVGLARAIYADSSILLLDDPFSSLDAKVGRAVLAALRKLASKGKIVVVVTSKRAVIQASDAVLMLSNGTQTYFGSYDDLAEFSPLRKGGKLWNFAIQQTTEDVKVELVPHNEKQENSNSCQIFKRLLKLSFGGAFMISCFIAFLCLIQAVSISIYYFPLAWADVHADWLLFYGLPGATGFLYLLGFLKNLLTYFGMLRSNLKVHKAAVKGILQSPYSFFGAIPVASILERFTKDVRVLDEIFFHSFNECVTLGMMLLGSIVVLAVLVPVTLFSLVFGLICFIHVFRFINPVANKLHKFDVVVRDNVLDQLTCILQGGATLRSCQEKSSFIQKAKHAAVDTMKSMQTYVTVQRFYQLLVDVTCISLVVLTVSSIVIFQESTDTVQRSLSIAIALSIGLIADAFAGAVHQLRVLLGSPERLMNFADLPAELQEPTESPNELAFNGCIQFSEVSLQYPGSLAWALRQFTLSIEPGKKVGVVGRTGSGKTSLLLTLFRLFEPTEGTIYIDGVDYKQFSLRTLRTQMAAVPQHPFLFRGTVRQNLDPYGIHSDDQCASMLQRVHLSAELTESVVDLNLSSGERQLLCIAKALLQPAPVIVMDEATSHLDIDSELHIMRLLNEELCGRTALIIAHRLVAVVETDTILMMHEGQVVETGAPKVLATNNSYFAAMIEASGPQESALLETLLFDN